MPVTARRTAIYARISTDETRQNPETPLQQLREYAVHRGFQIVGEYIDTASGKHAERTSYKKLIETVRKRQVDVVLVFHYDRLARSTIELITRVEEFHRLGIDFISYQQHVDTTTDIGKLYFTIMAGLAEYESAQIGRRCKPVWHGPRPREARVASASGRPHPATDQESTPARGIDPADRGASRGEQSNSAEVYVGQ